ncbi:MAG TPA: hypothetical protein VOA87_17155 [Thermoanaerobaculia bacterium]|nr:hypothetical protein [Thermoanaerobaculia bacterium]
MIAKPCRRFVACLGLAACLSLLPVQGAQAQAFHPVRAKSSHAAPHLGLLATLWHLFLQATTDIAPPPPSHEDIGASVDPWG